MLTRRQPQNAAQHIGSSRLERMPTELVLHVGSFLPVESRVALALTSRIMMSKIGGIGRGSRNMLNETYDDGYGVGDRKTTYSDDESSDGFDDESDDESSDESSDGHDADMDDIPYDEEDGNDIFSSRRAFLTLLERDSPVLIRCDYCEKLHSPFCPNKDPGHCGAPDNSILIYLSKRREVRITVSLVRAASCWRERGLKSYRTLLDSLAYSCITKVPRTQFSYQKQTKAKVRSSGDVILKQEFVIVSRRFGNGSIPTPHDLAVLNCVLGWASRTGWDRPKELNFNLQPYGDLLKTTCQSTEEVNGWGDCQDHSHKFNYDCFRDDIVAPRRILSPQLLCLLTHGLPCEQCNTNRNAKMLLGRADGRCCRAIDYSLNARDVTLEGKVGRVFIITAWKNFGNGCRTSHCYWESHFETSRHCASSSCGTGRGGIGEHCEAYEKIDGGALYVPRISERLIRELLKE